MTDNPINLGNYVTADSLVEYQFLPSLPRYVDIPAEGRPFEDRSEQPKTDST